MRHVWSLLLAVLAAPLAFVLAGRGLGGLAEVAAAAPQAERTDHFAIAAAAAALILSGVLLALLTMARIAPVGPAVAGLGHLAVGIAALVDPDRLVATVPGELVGLDDDRLLAAATVGPLLAVPLLVPLFLPGRWQGGRARPIQLRVVLPRRPPPPPRPPGGRPPGRPLLPRPAPPPPPPAVPGPEPPAAAPPGPAADSPAPGPPAPADPAAADPADDPPTDDGEVPDPAPAEADPGPAPQRPGGSG